MAWYASICFRVEREVHHNPKFGAEDCEEFETLAMRGAANVQILQITLRRSACTWTVLSKKEIEKKMDDRREEGLQQKIGQVQTETFACCLLYVATVPRLTRAQESPC